MKWRMPRFVPWASPYPLPEDTSRTLLAEGQCENFGLLQDRYLAYSDDRGKVQLVQEFTDRRALVPDYTPLADLIDAYRARWEETATAMGAATFTARPQWRVIVGMATNALLQGGITLHPVHGFPTMPASSLKGICRVYLERVLDQSADEVDRLLGRLAEESWSGDLIFFDGVPAGLPHVERDIINPIFADYYANPAVPPASYLTPKPIFFLAVGSRSVYRFAVASRSGDRDQAARGAEALQGALEELGVGAKTAAGYGNWVIEKPAESGEQAA